MQQAVFAALGWFGGLDVARELGKIQPADAHARRQLALARALIAHRHGLDGPFLPGAHGRAIAADRPLQRRPTSRCSAKTPQATANDLGKVQRTDVRNRGGAAAATRCTCGRREWTVFVNEELGRSFNALTRLTERPWIAAVLCRWYPERTVATAAVRRAHPAGPGCAHVDVVRSDGEIVYAGTAESE